MSRDIVSDEELLRAALETCARHLARMTYLQTLAMVLAGRSTRKTKEVLAIMKEESEDF